MCYATFQSTPNASQREYTYIILFDHPYLTHHLCMWICLGKPQFAREDCGVSGWSVRWSAEDGGAVRDPTVDQMLRDFPQLRAQAGLHCGPKAHQHHPLLMRWKPYWRTTAWNGSGSHPHSERLVSPQNNPCANLCSLWDASLDTVVFSLNSALGHRWPALCFRWCLVLVTLLVERMSQENHTNPTEDGSLIWFQSNCLQSECNSGREIMWAWKDYFYMSNIKEMKCCIISLTEEKTLLFIV